MLDIPPQFFKKLQKTMSTFVMAAVLFFAIGWMSLSVIIWSIRNGISPMPSSSQVRQTLLSCIPPNYSGTIYELGSGWGTLACPLARRFPRSTVVAYESSPVPYLFSKIRCFLFPLPNLQIYRRNFFYAPLSNAGFIVCYLYPGAMNELKAKFEKELNQSTIVLSNTFGIPGWRPLKVIDLKDIYHTKIYIYQQK